MSEMEASETTYGRWQRQSFHTSHSAGDHHSLPHTRGFYSASWSLLPILSGIKTETLYLKREIGIMQVQQRIIWLKDFSIFLKFTVSIFLSFTVWPLGRNRSWRQGSWKPTTELLLPIETPGFDIAFSPIPYVCGNWEGTVISNNHFLATGKAFCPSDQDSPVLR